MNNDLKRFNYHYRPKTIKALKKLADTMTKEEGEKVSVAKLIREAQTDLLAKYGVKL